MNNTEENKKKYLETSSVLFKTVITITAIGVLARSPLRALSLGLQSLIRRPKVKSLRSNEIETIRTKVHCNLNQGNDQFLVVRGPMGIGKSLVIRNALAHTWGAFFASYSITPGMEKGDIMDKVLGDFAFSTGFSYPSIYKIKVAERLIWWNNFLTLLSGHRRKPIVVIEADERLIGQPHAELAEAGQNLARMGLRVVIDCQDDAISDHFYSSQVRIDIEPMSAEMVEKIPEIQDLIEFLKKNNMYRETLAVLGGHIIAWSTLRIECFSDQNRSKTAVIERFLNIIMTEASHHRYSAICKNEKMEKLLERFVGQPATFCLEENEVRKYINSCEIGDNLKYVLRRSSDNIYKPASAAMSLLLRSGINKNAEITFDSIRECVEKVNKTNLTFYY